MIIFCFISSNFAFSLSTLPVELLTEDDTDDAMLELMDVCEDAELDIMDDDVEEADDDTDAALLDDWASAPWIKPKTTADAIRPWSGSFFITKRVKKLLGDFISNACACKQLALTWRENRLSVS